MVLDIKVWHPLCCIFFDSSFMYVCNLMGTTSESKCRLEGVKQKVQEFLLRKWIGMEWIFWNYAGHVFVTIPHAHCLARGGDNVFCTLEFISLHTQNDCFDLFTFKTNHRYFSIRSGVSLCTFVP